MQAAPQLLWLLCIADCNGRNKQDLVSDFIYYRKWASLVRQPRSEYMCAQGDIKICLSAAEHYIFLPQRAAAQWYILYIHAKLLFPFGAVKLPLQGMAFDACDVVYKIRSGSHRCEISRSPAEWARLFNLHTLILHNGRRERMGTKITRAFILLAEAESCCTLRHARVGWFLCSSTFH